MSDDDPSYPRCPKCGHVWHGIECDYIVDDAYASHVCSCATACVNLR